jgi:HK97 family phage portal protein
MNILSKLAFWAAQKAAIRSGVTISISENGENSQKLSSMLGGGRSITGKVVNDSTAMQVTTFFACARLLAETMGTMPSAIYRLQKSGNAEKVDHPLAEVLIHQPNSDMNGLEYREASTTNLAARGNAYSLIERRGDGNVMSLYPVPSSRWQVKRDASTDYEIRYGLNDRGKLEWYPAEKVWHRKGFGFDGLVGLSPIQCARETIGLSLAGEEYNAQLFAQGLMPSAIVSIPQWLKDEQRKVANEKLLEMHTGLKNLGKPMLLEGGMTVTSGLLTPDDAQFLQLRQLTASQICALLNIKPHMVAILEQATNNNIEQLSQEFVTYTMIPHMRRDEIAARKLFKPGDRSTYFYRYNADSLMRADSAARSMLYSILLQNGVFNRNEVRALENRNQVDDPAMDQYTVQSNMAMLDQLAGLIAARSNSKPTTQGAKP